MTEEPESVEPMPVVDASPVASMGPEDDVDDDVDDVSAPVPASVSDGSSENSVAQPALALKDNSPATLRARRKAVLRMPASTVGKCAHSAVRPLCCAQVMAVTRSAP